MMIGIFLIVPITHAQTVNQDLQTQLQQQLITLLEQMIATLTQELQTALAQQGIATSTVSSTITMSTSTVASTTIPQITVNINQNVQPVITQPTQPIGATQAPVVPVTFPCSQDHPESCANGIYRNSVWWLGSLYGPRTLDTPLPSSFTPVTYNYSDMCGETSDFDIVYSGKCDTSNSDYIIYTELFRYIALLSTNRFVLWQYGSYPTLTIGALQGVEYVNIYMNQSNPSLPHYSFNYSYVQLLSDAQGSTFTIGMDSGPKGNGLYIHGLKQFIYNQWKSQNATSTVKDQQNVNTILSQIYDDNSPMSY